MRNLLALGLVVTATMMVAVPAEAQRRGFSQRSAMSSTPVRRGFLFNRLRANRANQTAQPQTSRSRSATGAQRGSADTKSQVSKNTNSDRSQILQSDLLAKYGPSVLVK